VTYNTQHRFYCGVDLHARSMYVHVLDDKGQTRFDRDLPAGPDAFLQAVKPFRKDLVVGCECMFAWYWLADLCADERIPFALGHALAMKHIHQGKSKSDKIDAAKLAAMLRMIRAVPAVKAWVQRQEAKRGKRKALSVLEAKLGRAVYHLWRKQQAFDLQRFLQG
jgi:hypothetical protein